MQPCPEPQFVQDSPEERARLIRVSMCAFVCGLIGLIPIAGFLPALYAILLWIRVPRRSWNPAGKYLGVGAFLGVVSVFGSALLAAALVISAPWYDSFH